MAVNNPYANYKQNTVQTKSPGELTLMLYEGCLKFLKRAEKAMDEGQVEERNKNLIKAQDIIRELMVTLKTDTELGKNMMQLYDFILSRMVDANMNNDRAALKEAEEFVADFCDTWKQVVLLDRQRRHGVGAGAGNSGVAVGAGSSAGAGNGSGAIGADRAGRASGAGR
ncbi:flagellar export chaperone FliS [Evansella tamaricis]|uniref:Flagellar export chaperone FliS n=1 Tax=Evansella tamaricis TaxID=2069301 RepID=A0ABS6JGY9_9BACI|nr:flagellar export chaperone FliS [Evansella tamaricis]